MRVDWLVQARMKDMDGRCGRVFSGYDGFGFSKNARARAVQPCGKP